MARLTTYLDLESLEIQRSSFDFKSNLTSAIGDLANCNILASYVSRLNAMAYDRRQRHWRQQQWWGVQTTINYNRQQRHGGGGNSDGNSSRGRSNDCRGCANDCPRRWRRRNCLCHRLVRLWVLVLKIVCGVVRAGCVCAARPCYFVRLTCISAPKIGKPQHIGDCRKGLNETNQTITFY